MIKGLFSFIGLVFKLLGKILYYIFKGVSWYIKNTETVLKSYPKKKSKVLKIKEEIL